MEITTKELLNLVIILLKYLEKRGHEKITFVDEDAYYQKIWHKDRNLTKTPNITLGLLDEDIESIKSLLQGEAPNSYDLERLGALFTIIGATLDKE